MNPTPAVAVLMPQAVMGCLGREGGVKAVLGALLAADFPSLSEEDGGHIKASLEKGKLH